MTQTYHVNNYVICAFFCDVLVVGNRLFLHSVVTACEWILENECHTDLFVSLH